MLLLLLISRDLKYDSIILADVLNFTIWFRSFHLGEVYVGAVYWFAGVSLGLHVIHNVVKIMHTRNLLHFTANHVSSWKYAHFTQNSKLEEVRLFCAYLEVQKLSVYLIDHPVIVGRYPIMAVMRSAFPISLLSTSLCELVNHGF